MSPNGRWAHDRAGLCAQCGASLPASEKSLRSIKRENGRMKEAPSTRVSALGQKQTCAAQKVMSLYPLTNPAYRFKRIGLEAGPLSQWLYSALGETNLPVICVETRTYRRTLDVPARFRNSRAVGAVLGLTPCWYQSGENDHTGAVTWARSRCGRRFAREVSGRS